jgi:hypothetical protein
MADLVPAILDRKGSRLSGRDGRDEPGHDDWGCASPRHGRPCACHFGAHGEVSAAIQRETSIKRWPRAWKTRLIYAFNPTWRDLYQDLNN